MVHSQDVKAKSRFAHEKCKYFYLIALQQGWFLSSYLTQLGMAAGFE